MESIAEAITNMIIQLQQDIIDRKLPKYEDLNPLPEYFETDPELPGYSTHMNVDACDIDMMVRMFNL